jgi:hypothetical protein
VAEPVTEIENAARDRHQLRTLAVAITTTSAVLCAVTVAVIYAMPLNRLWFLHFPLGLFWYVRVQERIDHTRSINEEIA